MWGGSPPWQPPPSPSLAMKLAKMPMPVRVPRPAWAKARKVFLDDREKIAPARPALGWMCSLRAQFTHGSQFEALSPVYSQPAGVAHGRQPAAQGFRPRDRMGKHADKNFSAELGIGFPLIGFEVDPRPRTADQH